MIFEHTLTRPDEITVGDRPWFEPAFCLMNRMEMLL